MFLVADSFHAYPSTGRQKLPFYMKRGRLIRGGLPGGGILS
jgi:hypothetical protein